MLPLIFGFSFPKNSPKGVVGRTFAFDCGSSEASSSLVSFPISLEVDGEQCCTLNFSRCDDDRDIPPLERNPSTTLDGFTRSFPALRYPWSQAHEQPKWASNLDLPSPASVCTSRSIRVPCVIEKAAKTPRRPPSE